MSQVSVKEAEADLSKLIERAAKGEVVTIVRDGEPVATLIAASSQVPAVPTKQARPSLVDYLKSFPGDEEFERNRSPSRIAEL